MKKAVRASGVLVGAVALCLAGTGAASAAEPEFYLSETAPGAWGTMEFGFESGTRVAPIYLRIKDTKADGLSAKMRVQAATDAGTKSYAWRTAAGNGEITKDTTYLYDSSGVNAVRIQVCNSNNVCTWSPWVHNNVRT